MMLRECGACAWEQGRLVQKFLRDTVREGQSETRSEVPAEVADIAAHEDEGRRCDACEAADVPDAMAWGIEQGEGSVVEKVVRGEFADVEICVEGEGR